MTTAEPINQSVRLDDLIEAIKRTHSTALDQLSDAVLVYLPRARRAEFVDLVRSLPVRWIAQEGPEVLPDLTSALPDDRQAPGDLVLALDGWPVARTAPHGGRIDWVSTTQG